MFYVSSATIIFLNAAVKTHNTVCSAAFILPNSAEKKQGLLGNQLFSSDSLGSRYANIFKKSEKSAIGQYQISSPIHFSKEDAFHYQLHHKCENQCRERGFDRWAHRRH